MSRGRRPGRPSTLQAGAFLEAIVATVTNDDVIKHADPEQFSCGYEPSGDLEVVNGRRRITRWMIVTNHDGRRVREQGRLEYLTRVNHRGVERAAANLVVRNHAVL